jgi:hypothetical protein
MFNQFLKRLSLVVGCMTFGVVLGASFLAGGDPLWAVGRAAGAAAAMLAGFRATSGLALLLAGPGAEDSDSLEAAGAEAAPSAQAVAG